MPRKKLILHIGYPKTGSSALQAFFSGNVDALRRAGVDYPYAEPMASVLDGNCSGNLLQILFRGGYADRFREQSGVSSFRAAPLVNHHAADLFALLTRSVLDSPCPTILLSGEIMSTLADENWHHLEALADQVDLHVVAFARDCFDYTLSSWKQGVKTDPGGYAPSFAESLWYETEPNGRMFTNYARLARSRLHYTLLNYDTYRRDLVKAFFEAAGLPPLADAVHHKRQYNPSLTMSEAIVAQRAALVLNNQMFATTVVRMLLDRADRPAEVPFYSRELHGQLLDMHGAVLATMNSVIVGDKLSTVLRETPTTPEMVDPADLDVLLQAIRRVSGLTDAAAEWVPGSSAGRTEAFYDPDGLPHDFDPTAYLFHNPDVALAGVDPREHFVRHGRGELRRYRYA